MKYLQIRKPRVGAERPTAQTIRAHKDYVLSKLKDGVAYCVYAFVGGGLLHPQRRLARKS